MDEQIGLVTMKGQSLPLSRCQAHRGLSPPGRCALPGTLRKKPVPEMGQAFYLTIVLQS